MSPTLMDGDRVLVIRHWPRRWLRKGQIVIYRFPEFIPLFGDQEMAGSKSTSVVIRNNIKGSADQSDHDDIEENDLKQVHDLFLIKRIIGLPNDQVVTHISNVQDNVRDRVVDLHDQNGFRDWLIPLGYSFIKSDYIGLDSTILGPVPLKDCLGIVLFKMQK